MGIQEMAKAAWPYARKAGPYVVLVLNYLKDAENREKLSEALEDARDFINQKDLPGRFQRAKTKVKKTRTSRQQRKVAKVLINRMDAPNADLENIAQDLLLVKEAAVKPLCGKLDNEDPSVRKTTAWLLGEINDLDALVPLVKASGDPNLEVRNEIENSIRKILKTHELEDTID